jgi:hypothetical protein
MLGRVVNNKMPGSLVVVISGSNFGTSACNGEFTRRCNTTSRSEGPSAHKWCTRS